MPADPTPSDERTLDIVFATKTAIVSHPRTGSSVAVNHGAHWSADDPIVLAYPSFFTADARYGLSSSDPFGEDGYPVRRGGKSETASAAPGERRRRG